MTTTTKDSLVAHNRSDGVVSVESLASESKSHTDGWVFRVSGGTGIGDLILAAEINVSREVFWKRFMYMSSQDFKQKHGRYKHAIAFFFCSNEN